MSMCLVCSEIEGVIYLCLMLWLDHWVMEFKNWFVNEWIVLWTRLADSFKRSDSSEQSQEDVGHILRFLAVKDFTFNLFFTQSYHLTINHLTAPVLIHFHYFQKSSLIVLQKLIFSVPQTKESQSGWIDMSN